MTSIIISAIMLSFNLFIITGTNDTIKRIVYSIFFVFWLIFLSFAIKIN